MRLRYALILGILIGAANAAAETAAPLDAATPQPPSATDKAPAPDAAGNPDRERFRAEREQCRTQAKSQGLEGPAMRQAVRDCVAKLDPVAAKRMQCMETGRSQNLSGSDLRTFVRDCAAKS